MQTRSTTFSYLPAGTPPWPTAVPPGYAYRTMPPTLPVPANTVDAIPAMRSSAAEKRADSEKRKRLSAPAVILLLLASILVGGGAMLSLLYANGQFGANAPVATRPLALPTPGAASTPGASSTAATGQLPTPNSFQTINSSQLQVSLQYPGDWVADPAQTSQSGDVAVHLHPPQALSVDFFINQLSASDSASFATGKDLNAAALTGFGQVNNLSGPQALGNTPQTRQFGGASWDEADATYTQSQGGDSLHVVSLSVKYKNHYYNVLFSAPGSQFNDAMQKYYTQMLSSFKFTA